MVLSRAVPEEAVGKGAVNAVADLNQQDGPFLPGGGVAITVGAGDSFDQAV